MLTKIKTNALTLGTIGLMVFAAAVYLTAGVASTSGIGGPTIAQAAPTPTPEPSPTPCTTDDPKKPCPTPTPSPTPRPTMEP